MAVSQILVVEDESILALYIKRSLESLGYRVAAVVDSGDLALQETEKKRPDLVLMDVRIKGEMDGIDTAEQIYERFDVPVVYLTAYADENTLQRAKQTAPYGYLLKPFDEQDLRPAIEIALNRHKLEKKLRNSERWFSTTLKSMGDAVAVTDVRGQIIYMNPGAENLILWPANQAMGQDLTRVFTQFEKPGEKQLENMAVAVIQKGIVLTAENRILLDRQGRERIVDNSAAPIRDEAGNVVGAVLIFREIVPGGVTKGKGRRRRPEELPPDSRLKESAQLATQAAQLASLGVMAAGISHEISQPLHAILVSANSVLFWHKRNVGVLPDTFIKKIHDIADYAGRIDQIISHMQSFWMASDQEEMEITDLNEAVRSAMMLIDRKIHTHGIKPQLELEGEALNVRGSILRLEQVIINLITNAITSMDRAANPDKWIRLSTYRDKTHALLEVQDNGPAVDEAILDKVYDPFFTYLKTDEGYELKLAISKMFVEELKGQIEVVSQPKSGTTYSVRFPLVERKREKIHENLVS